MFKVISFKSAKAVTVIIIINEMNPMLNFVVSLALKVWVVVWRN